ncbi:MAG TPA: multicopper oxidase domain-containing protein [Devosia sp.]|nr:multicopper oxidase domain-containing protein [Devosia sp.]
MDTDRRSLLALAAITPLTAAAAPRRVWAQAAAPAADHRLRISTGLAELAPDQIVSTTLYNDQFPGPLLRMREGERTSVEVINDTNTPELVHWHGQMIPSAVDGAAEEGTPYIPPHARRVISFEPKPAGFRFYHTHVVAGPDLSRGTYTGQAGPLYIEPKNDPGRYDREVFLTLKEFSPTFSKGGDMAVEALAGDELPALKAMGAANDAKAVTKTKGYEVGYQLFSINGKMLGHGEPIRVRQGERVLFHVLNASAGEIRSLALPGHRFRVVTLDGNPVATPAEVPVLWLGTAERVSAIVEMNHPGVWVMGDLSADDRGNGMGIVVEYAGRSGKPVWAKPLAFRWDYAAFGRASGVQPPDVTMDFLIEKHNAALDGFNQWTLNGKAFSMADNAPVYPLHEGKRYRLRFRNGSDDIHPLHLHRHSFELSHIHGKPTGGVIKDVVMLGGYQELAFDFTADNPGDTLFHCHQQLHMDYGLMMLFRYV